MNKDRINQLAETGKFEQLQDELEDMGRDYPYGNTVEPYDIQRELELTEDEAQLLSEQDPITGAILNSED